MSDAAQIQDPKPRKLFEEVHSEWIQASQGAFRNMNDRYLFGLTMAYDGVLSRIKTLDKEGPGEVR